MKNNWKRLRSAAGAVGTAAVMTGCRNMPLLDPQGPVGEAERFVILTAFGLMLIVVIPVFVMTAWFARKYRASNPNADYAPRWSYSGKIDLVVWLVPFLIVSALGTLAWKTTHHLDPYKALAAKAAPIRIEAVALDWKWLFIYPDYNIATVNRLVFPAKTPLSFRITSDTVLSSFFIPRLGSQIYAMAGRETRLHLMADSPGTYHGHNQQFSGRGYADMHFEAMATAPERFATWVQETRRSTEKLDQARYAAIARPSADFPVTTFSSVSPGLFEAVIDKYRTSGAKASAAHDIAALNP